MSVSINTSLTVINETDVRGEAMLALIKNYITFPNAFYGFKSIGVHKDELRFPVLFVEPKSMKAAMESMGKFKMKWTYAIYWYVRDNKAQDVISQSTFIAQALVKLFSNDALGDLQTTGTKKFKQYPNPSGGYYWLDSEMTAIDWSVNYLDPEVAPRLRYERAGRMMVDIMDIIIV